MPTPTANAIAALSQTCLLRILIFIPLDHEFFIHDRKRKPYVSIHHRLPRAETKILPSESSPHGGTSHEAGLSPLRTIGETTTVGQHKTLCANHLACAHP